MLNSDTNERPDWVSPPGDTILSILEERELTVEQFAYQIGRPASVAQKLLDGKHTIDSILARQLTLTLGASDSFWLAREYDYRASVSEVKAPSASTLESLLDKLPIRDMQKFGWIAKGNSKEDKIAEFLSFFNVSTLAQWQGKYEHAFQKAAYRRSFAHTTCEYATTAWLRQGEIETEGDDVAKWCTETLKEQIQHMKRLTWYKSPSLFLPKLKEMLAESGVKFAIVRSPKGCTSSGAVRILPDGTPHLQLSFRYLSDDQFWFSLFHEIGHLILHYDYMPIVEQPDLAEDECETEANTFAVHTIIPMEHQEEFLTLGGSRFPIISFAKKIGVAPGLIVGQLQHQGLIRYNQMQHLKRRYQWSN